MCIYNNGLFKAPSMPRDAGEISPVVLDLCFRKTRPGMSHDDLDDIGWKAPFSKCFLSTLKDIVIWSRVPGTTLPFPSVYM